jgi:hypothetical protein
MVGSEPGTTVTSMRLRQLAVVTRDTEAVEADLFAMLDLEIAWRFDGVDKHGLGTVFIPVGNDFFEIVLAAEPGSAADKFIERRGGQGGFVVMIECGDLVAARERVEGCNGRIVDAGDTPDLGAYFQIHPKDTAGTYLQLVQPYGLGAGEDDGPWIYGGADWRDARRIHLATGIAAAEIQADDPAEAARSWSLLLDVELGADTAGNPVLQLEQGSLRFVEATDDRGPGLGAFDLSSPDPEEVRHRAAARGCVDESGVIVIGGLRMHVVQAGE